MNVGEQTGSDPEVFNDLAKYYASRIQQVKDFRAAIAWPVIQLVAAICIIGLLVFILGILPACDGGQPFDVLGLGLYGATGAGVWFMGWIGAAVAGFVFWKMASNRTTWQVALQDVVQPPLRASIRATHPDCAFSHPEHRS